MYPPGPSETATIGARTLPAGDGAGRSLAVKLFAATFPVMVLAVMATQAAVGWLEYHTKLTALETRTRLLASLTVQAIERPLWTTDHAVYRAQIAALASDPAFVYARLDDEQGALLDERGHRPTAAGGTIAVSLPVPDPMGGTALGRFQLVMSKAELKDTARRSAVIGLGAIVVLLLVVFGTVHTMTRRLILKPLKAMLEAMGRVERNVWTTVDLTSDDEMGRALQAFNRMVDGLRSGDEAKRLLAQLEQANRLILESIGYARRIQDGLLPDPKALADRLAELHMHWEPLQLVGGDYCWLQPLGRRSLVFIADCTGHGVPGAFMTMVVAAALEQFLTGGETADPGSILEGIDSLVRCRLRQNQPGSISDDGLDAAVCLWDPDTRTVTYAGANIPLFYSAAGQIVTIKGNRSSLGYRTLPARPPFENHTIAVEPGMGFYLFTDGIADHMGGQPRRLFGRGRLARLLADCRDRPLAEQIEGILSTLEDYRGEEPRRDDMAAIAFRPI